MKAFVFVQLVVLIGDSGVGKSNLLSRFTRNEFNPREQKHDRGGVRNEVPLHFFKIIIITIVAFMKLCSIELNYISLSYFYGLLLNYIYTYLTFFCFGIDCSVGPYLNG